MLLKLFKLFLLFGTSLFLLVGCSLYMMQRKLLYYPDTQDFFNCPQFDDYQKVNHNGTRFYYKKRSKKLVVFYHGNAGSACDRAFLKPLFKDANYSAIIVEYTGYSNDPRTPTKALLEENIKHVVDFIEQEEITETVVIGESLGSAMACYHSTQMPVAQLLLLSPFETMVKLVQEKYPLFPVALLLKDQYNNADNLKDFTQSISIIHGSQDQLIPIHHARKLFDGLSSSAKTFVPINGAGHNDLYSSKETLKQLREFLK